MGSRDKDKDKGVNVQVLLRCRPFNEDEVRCNAPQVISCNDHRREVTVCQNIASKQIDRTFTFDKVFGPQSQQKDLYDQAVVPIVHEVLDGFNCTIFAYGQTGTGKTYTMEGSGRKTKHGGLPDEAGVIPRSVQQIFDTLESQHAEYSVKVTFLELYNEEITDLLAPEEFCKPLDDKQRKPLALMEDGKGGVLVRGLEEEMVASASEIYSLLERGSAKRRTAETLLNKQSSRSHSIFSITIHIKEATPEGEELIKCGKLNLVDLAGSENISRSGAREGRAREAGEINKSLLTLGRVITALVEHLAHVPYRDSKLTRLLRDSLGGKTKTCIIATVSPSVHCLDETLSTLDYAHRAKNIRNKPEVNQKMMKSALIKDLYGEIERLKVEVYAAREKNGIYLPRERFLQDELDKKNMTEKIELMEFDIEAKDKHIEELQNRVEVQNQEHLQLCSNLEATQASLHQCQKSLSYANEVIKQARYANKEQSHVIAAQCKAETRLADQATELQAELQRSVEELAGLFEKLERKSNVEVANNQVVGDFRNLLGKQMEVLSRTVLGSVSAQRQLVCNMEHHLESFLASKDQLVDKLKSKIDGLKSTYLTQAQNLCDLVRTHETDSTSTLHNLNDAVSDRRSSLDELLARHVANAEAILLDLQSSLSDQQHETALFAELQREAARQSMEMVQDTVRGTLDSLSSLHTSAVELAEAVATRSKDHDDNLMALQDSYADQAKFENSQMFDGISELVTHSMSRMLSLVQSRVCTLREANMSEAMKARKGLLGFQQTALSAQDHLNSFLKSADINAVDTSSILAAKACQIQEVLDTCLKHAATAAEHWKKTHESVQEFEGTETSSFVSLITQGVETNQLLTSKLLALSSFIESHVEQETRESFHLLEDSRQSDHDGVVGCRAITQAQVQEMDQLEVSHGKDSRELEQITAEKFDQEYREDQSTGITPIKRAVNVPSLGAINSLRAPALDLLKEEFRLTHSELEGDDTESKQFSGKLRSSVELAVRPPLVSLN